MSTAAQCSDRAQSMTVLPTPSLQLQMRAPLELEVQVLLASLHAAVNVKVCHEQF